MPQKILKSHQNDVKLRDDMLKLVHKHHKQQKGTKILTGLRLKFKERKGDGPNQNSRFELLGITMEWKYTKDQHKRKSYEQKEGA